MSFIAKLSCFNQLPSRFSILIMPKRSFNFQTYKQRHVAFKVAYFGWDYHGLASQLNVEATIETQIINALIHTKLVESAESCMLVKCGRTDKDVSAYGQVINLNVRSALTDESDPANLGLFTPEGYSDISEPPPIKKDREKTTSELDYISILNRHLPDKIRILAWSPVAREFSSRFNCQSRKYSYVFPKSNMCIESMSVALNYLVGEHDFRNFCKFNITNNVLDHNRCILSAMIEEISQPSILIDKPDIYTYCRVIITGKAFLYHQIRCIMSLIFLIGARLEKPELIKELLDIEKCPSRPMYSHSNALPLSLMSCDFKEEDLPFGWLYSENSLISLRKSLRKIWCEYRTKSMMIEDVLSQVEKNFSVNSQPEESGNNIKEFGFSRDANSIKCHRPVMKRVRHETLEERIRLERAKQDAKNNKT